jgi:hypothetical protein
VAAPVLLSPGMGGPSAEATMAAAVAAVAAVADMAEAAALAAVQPGMCGQQGHGLTENA